MAKNDGRPFVVRSHDVRLDSEYVAWMRDVKKRFRSAQIKAAVKVNSEQLLFNWQLGRDLVTRKAEEKWGAGIVEQVSLDLKAAFPESKGFSTRNLRYMMSWYSFYADSASPEILQQLAAEFEQVSLTAGNRLNQLGSPVEDSNLQQPAASLAFPEVFAFVPWMHHVAIITKCSTVEEALFYVRRTIEEGWSRRQLEDNLEADLYHRAGKALTNFAKRLPESQARLAQEITKDTYDLSFVSLPKGYSERQLEDALERNITRFLLELGTGFAYVGRQKEFVASGRSRQIDMLFYHINLRCYVVVELKCGEFEPEYAGKLNFYVNAMDSLMKNPTENPTIGLLICKHASATDVQWAFGGIQTPMGVATYTNVREQEARAQLPTVEQIQRQIELTEEELRLEKGETNG